MEHRQRATEMGRRRGAREGEGKREEQEQRERRMTAGRLIAVVGLLVGPVAYASGSEKLNVLFVAVDDLRPEFGAYGAAYVKSPNLDRLAARGFVFNRAYCQQAVCSPSRSSL